MVGRRGCLWINLGHGAVYFLRKRLGHVRLIMMGTWELKEGADEAAGKGMRR